MLVQKKEVLQGEWAKINKDIFDGDIITIMDEGKLVSGTYGERHVFKIKTKTGDIKLLTFNQTTMNYLIDAYGNDTENWRGKEAKVWIVKSNVGGKIKDVVYLTHPGAIL
jgi:hypothetical protein